MTIRSATNGPVELRSHYKPTSSSKINDMQLSGEEELTFDIDIIDIRHDAVEINLKEEIDKLLHPAEGPKKLPTMLLYDERGLQIFEKAKTPVLGLSTCLIYI
jgi:hypothetical protein